MRAALRYLASLVGRGDEDDHLVELAVVVVLIVVVAILSLVFLADPIADLVTLIGGRVDRGCRGPLTRSTPVPSGPHTVERTMVRPASPQRDHGMSGSRCASCSRD